MSIKQRARIRAKSWALFLNETNKNSNDGLSRKLFKIKSKNNKKILFKILNVGVNGILIMNFSRINIYGVIDQ
jgi:hypothetical protein